MKTLQFLGIALRSIWSQAPLEGTRFSTVCHASRHRQIARDALGRVDAGCDSVCAGRFECHAADGKNLR